MNGFDWKTHLPLLIVGAAVLQWLIFLAISTLRRKQRVSVGLIISSVALAVTWMVVFDVRALFATQKAMVEAIAAAPARPAAKGTCASLKVGMAAEQVKETLGPPDEDIAEEDTRGPGARMWRYRDSRCSVHLIENTVEFID